jgi:hypothetical protein
MRKQLGETNKKAREAAVTALTGLKGKNVKTLNSNEVKDLLNAILQFLGLADEHGVIK